MQWWSHFARECPLSVAGRQAARLPQHFGKVSHDGTDENFETKVRDYLQTPWVQTALIGDPRIAACGPADPPIVIWQVPKDRDALFSSDCFGDGSCSKEVSVLHQRAGWSVGEVGRDLRGRLAVGCNAHGTLPGPVQSAEGAELYAFLHWLRH